MTPFKVLDGFDAILSAQNKTETKVKAGRGRQHINERDNVEPFGKVLHSVERRKAEAPRTADRAEKPQSAQSASQSPPVDEGALVNGNKKNIETPETGEPSKKSESPVQKDFSEGLAIGSEGLSIAPLQKTSETTAAVLSIPVQPIVENDVENASIAPEGLALETVSSAPISEEGPKPSAMPLQEKPMMKVAQEKDLSFQEVDALGGEDAAVLENESPMEAEGLRAGLKESAGVEKTESTSKPAQEASMKTEGKGFAPEGEQDFSESRGELEKRKEGDVPTFNPKDGIKILSSESGGLQPAEGMRAVRNDAPLSAMQKNAVLSQVGERLIGLHVGKTERIRFQLEPETLGAIQIELTMQKGGVIAHIVTGDLQVKALLEANQGLLRDRLSEQGFRVDQFSVDVGGMGRSFDEKPETAPFSRGRQGFRESDFSASPAGFFPAAVRGNGLINVYI